jgi:hypothetical protein
MTFDPNNPSNLNRRPGTAYGLGAGGWTAVIVVVVLLVIGAFYLMSENGVNTTASNPAAPTARETTGSAPTSPAPRDAPPQPASPPAGR